MGTATMRFNEGVFIEGDSHGGANQLVVTGSISMMGAGASLNLSANPTTTETMNTTDWYYLAGNGYAANVNSVQPRNPLASIPITGGGNWTNEIYTFWGQAPNAYHLFSSKTPITGNVTISFLIIGGGDINSNNTTNYIKLADSPSATVNSNGTLGAPNKYDWTGGAGDTYHPVQLMYSTTGYAYTDTWNVVSASTNTFHGYYGSHPQAGSKNIVNSAFTRFTITISGIQGTYYLGLRQHKPDSYNYNAWAIADFSITQDSLSYFNFEGASWNQGENGMGFRNNSGVLEYKDDGGTWTSFADGYASGDDRSVQFNDNGAFGGGMFYYSDSNKVGIGKYTDDPAYLLSIQGNHQEGGNRAQIYIQEYSESQPPEIILDRYGGTYSSPQALTTGELLSSIQSHGFVGATTGPFSKIETVADYLIATGGKLNIGLRSVADSSWRDVISIRSHNIEPQSSIVTNNIGAYSVGSSTASFDTTFTKAIRGPSASDLQIEADDNDIMMYLGTGNGSSYSKKVGIGTNIPGYTLTVKSPSGSTNAPLELLNNTTDGSTIRLTRSASSVANSEGIGTIRFGVDHAAFPSTSHIQSNRIGARAIGSWNINPGSLFQASELFFTVKKTVEGVVSEQEILTLNTLGSTINSDLSIDGSVTITGTFETDYDLISNDDVIADGDLISNRWRMNQRNNDVNGSSLIGEYTEGFTINSLDFNPNDIAMRFRFHDEDGNVVLNITEDGKSFIGTAGGTYRFSNYGTVNQVTDGGMYVEGNSSNGAVAMFMNRNDGLYGDGIAIACGYGSYKKQSWSDPIGFPTSENGWVKLYGKKRSYALQDQDDPNDSDPTDVILLGAIRGDGNGGVDYNTSFTGAHCCVLQGTLTDQLGFIVSSSGNLWLNGSVGISTCLPYVKLSNTSKDKTVFGVIASYSPSQLGYLERAPIKDNEVYIQTNSIGEGKIWITNVIGSPTNGDYVTSSTIQGYGQLQDDDILHSYTVAKITEAIDWSKVQDTIDHEGITYKRYLAGCTYHCG